MGIRQAYRIVTFLPADAAFIKPRTLIEKINESVPVTYGRYDLVAFYTEGVEQFRPLSQSNPEYGQLESGKSLRLEFSIPYEESLLSTCLDLVQELHPWEEPVIQVYTVSETIRSA